MVALAVSQSLATLEWLGGHFSPATLFATSEPGVWYDPSDVANTNWLYNLLTFTEQFDNAYWTKGSTTVSANSIASPDGSITADTIVSTVGTGEQRVYASSLAPTTALTYTYSVYAKANGANWLVARDDFRGFGDTSFDLVNGVVGTVASSRSAAIVSAGSGWYRCSVTTTVTTAAAGGTVNFCLSDTDNGRATFVGNGVKGFYLWGAQLEIGSTATTYQPITTVNAGTIARFPYATLYQDIAGTTPVTAPNQPVGMMLSKDKGLVLGPEIVTNGNNETALYSGSGAVSGTLVRGAAPGGGFAAVFTCNAGFLSHQALYITIAANTPVQISVRMYVPTGSLTTAQLFDATDGSWSGASTTVKDNWVTLTSIRNAKATSWILGMGQIAGQSIGGQVFYVDDLSIKALPGNHATQSTSGSRPTYGIVPATGRRNLLLQTEDFTVSPWAATVVGTSTRVNTASPYSFGLGLITATSANGGIRQMVGINSFVAGQTGSLTFFVQSASSSLSIVFENGTATYGQSVNVTLNPSNGTAGALTGFTSATSVPFGTGYIYTLNMPVAGGTLAANLEFRLPNGASMLLGRPQIQVGSATAYQRVVTAFEVTEANVASLSYISFDGIDDFMITPTITPGTDKVQVFAGVRKLSDATTGMVIEASTALSSNLGAFFLAAPNGAASNYSFVSKGSIPTFGSDGLANGFAAPTTNVVTGLGDISGNSVIIRVNATQRAIATTVQGTGNYLAYPLYLGRRGGTTLPFNGQMYGLITRFGANLNTSQLVSTEGWLNTKTGAY